VPRGPAYPSSSAIAAAAAYLRARDADAALAVVDSHGVVRGYNLDMQFTSASVVKAMLLVAYLRTHASVSPAMQETLRLMIMYSNNAAAFSVFAIVGAGGLADLARASGMKHFAVGSDVLYSRITAADQARFFFAMDSYIPAAHRTLARYLLSNIASFQAWGIPEVARPRWRTYFKNGWLGAKADPFRVVNQVVRLEHDDTTWSVAVLSDDNPHSPYAFETLRGVADRLLGE
jgi:hypothetical protein